MQYMGSKNRHAKEILPLILAGRKDGQAYVEPFVGGANVIDKVDGVRIGNDSHPHLIALLSALADGWKPPETFTEDQYRKAKEEKTLDALTGFIGFSSFGSKWFGGFPRGNDAAGIPRDIPSESSRNVTKQAPRLAGVKFTCGPYQEMEIPPESVIYCDPPYAGPQNILRADSITLSSGSGAGC